MQTPSKEEKRPNHRPLKDIDWNRVDKLLISGTPSTKIADALGICVDTLYIRCEKEKNMTYSAYSQQKRANGESILHEAQFDKAIGNTEKGDTTLLIFLGKVRLDQKETTNISVAPEIEKNYVAMMQHLAEMQKTRHNGSSSKTEETQDESREH